MRLFTIFCGLLITLSCNNKRSSNGNQTHLSGDSCTSIIKEAIDSLNKHYLNSTFIRISASQENRLLDSIIKVSTNKEGEFHNFYLISNKADSILPFTNAIAYSHWKNSFTYYFGYQAIYFNDYQYRYDGAHNVYIRVCPLPEKTLHGKAVWDDLKKLMLTDYETSINKHRKSLILDSHEKIDIDIILEFNSQLNKIKTEVAYILCESKEIRYRRENIFELAKIDLIIRRDSRYKSSFLSYYTDSIDNESKSTNSPLDQDSVK
jgi:hypothetical protein